MNEFRKLYAYINITNDMVAWEAAIGRLSSVDLLEFQNIYTLSLRQFSVFKNLVENNQADQIIRELEIESIRKAKFNSKSSRLRGIYFFSSKEHAEAVVERWKGYHFNPNYLSEIAFRVINYSEFDSEWITHNFNSDDLSWVENYLSGETYGEMPLTEIIASGFGIVLNKDLRQRAYDMLAKKYPDSLPILQLSCLGFDKGIDDIGQNVPYLINTGKSIKGVYIINMRQFEAGSQIFKMIDEGKIQVPRQPETWSGNIRVPDFRHLGFEVDFENIPDYLHIGNDRLSFSSKIKWDGGIIFKPSQN